MQLDRIRKNARDARGTMCSLLGCAWIFLTRRVFLLSGIKSMISMNMFWEERDDDDQGDGVHVRILCGAGDDNVWPGIIN